MTDKIEPALTAAEWAGFSHVYPQKHLGHTTLDLTGGHLLIEQLRGGNRVNRAATYITAELQPGTLSSVIALANAGLPGTDPRKITRELVNALRAVSGRLGRSSTAAEVQMVERFADALASYLPPETADPSAAL